MFISRERWTELETKVRLLSEELMAFRNEELQKLRKESAELQEKAELLEHVKLKVKKAVFVETADTVIIEYEAPRVELEFSDGKQVTKSDFLRATNILKLVSLEDQEKIFNAIEKAKERRTNG